MPTLDAHEGSMVLAERAAAAAVRHASALARVVQCTLGASDARVKSDTSPVTVGDFGVQAVVSLSLRAQLHAAAGGAAAAFRLIAEEDAATLASGPPELLAHVVAAVNAAYPPAAARAEAAAALAALVATWAGGGASPSRPHPPVADPALAALFDRDAWRADDVLAAVGAGEFGEGAPGAPVPPAGAPPSACLPRHWMLDPVDGTKGFLRGATEPGAGHQYCVGLALLDGGEPVVGVLGCPSLPFPSLRASHTGGAAGGGGGFACVGTLFTARSGLGTWQEPLGEGMTHGDAAPHRVRVFGAPPATPSATVVCESFEAGHSDHALSSRVAAALGIASAASPPPVRMDSMAKYGLLARGDAHVYLRFPRAGYVENAWDHAAGSVVLREAGGVVTDAAGAPLDFSAGRALARNVGVLASVGPPGWHADCLVPAVAAARG